jgi:hypothetical protein
VGCYFTLALLLYPTHTNPSFLVVAFNHGKYLDLWLNQGLWVEINITWVKYGH